MVGADAATPAPPTDFEGEPQKKTYIPGGNRSKIELKMK